MFRNKVIEILEIYVGQERITFISGEILKIGTKDCHLSEDRGSVYGIAVAIEDEREKALIFQHLNERSIQLEQWNPIGDNFYPLYWGKDCNMGSRLKAHTKSLKKTSTLQLNNERQQILSNKKVIYGAVPCLHAGVIEKHLQEAFPGILITKKLKNDECSYEVEVNGDEVNGVTGAIELAEAEK